MPSGCSRRRSRRRPRRFRRGRPRRSAKIPHRLPPPPCHLQRPHWHSSLSYRHWGLILSYEEFLEPRWCMRLGQNFCITKFVSICKQFRDFWPAQTLERGLSRNYAWCLEDCMLNTCFGSNKCLRTLATAYYIIPQRERARNSSTGIPDPAGGQVALDVWDSCLLWQIVSPTSSVDGDDVVEGSVDLDGAPHEGDY